MYDIKNKIPLHIKSSKNMNSSLLIRIIIGVVIVFQTAYIYAQMNTDKTFILQQLDKKYDSYSNIAKQIWDFAELGYLETRSSALLQKTLEKEGFTLETGVAEIPTAFVATYGNGKPVIGILAEFDALPGLSRIPLHIKNRLSKGAQVMVAVTICLVRLLWLLA